MSRVWGFVLGFCFVLFFRLKIKIATLEMNSR